MKTPIDPNSPAFPLPGTFDAMPSPGLTIRAQLAAMAMQGMASSSYWAENFNSASPGALAAAVKIAIAVADEMIAELNR